MTDSIAELRTIVLPQFLGEHMTGLLFRGGRGRWQRIASGNRRRAEDEVRFLRRNHVKAWIRPASGKSHEVIVRTRDAEVARALLNAPSSSRAW
ncbi:MAG TPA: hypothetical protein VFA25_01825 [Actinomycetota bacterium]|nr:hypothetical protein [Actinomycetota bacterium]